MLCILLKPHIVVLFVDLFVAQDIHSHVVHFIQYIYNAIIKNTQD